MIHSSHDGPTSHLNLTDSLMALTVLLRWKYRQRILSCGDLALGQNLVLEWSGTSAVESMGNSCRKRNGCLRIATKMHFNQPLTCFYPYRVDGRAFFDCTLWPCVKQKRPQKAMPTKKLYLNSLYCCHYGLKNIKLSHKTKSFVRRKSFWSLFHVGADGWVSFGGDLYKASVA